MKKLKDNCTGKYLNIRNAYREFLKRYYKQNIFQKTNEIFSKMERKTKENIFVTVLKKKVWEGGIKRDCGDESCLSRSKKFHHHVRKIEHFW